MKLSPISLSSIYYVRGQRPKNGRRPQTGPFPYNGCLPLALRNEVSYKLEKSNKAACVSEVADLLACLKDHDFNDKMCVKETQELSTCYNNFRVSVELKKKQSREGLLVPGERDLSARQLNTLLKKHPQPDIKK